MTAAPPPPSAETEARATHRQRALLVELFFFCPVRLCGLCVPRALSDSGGVMGGGAPPGTATAYLSHHRES